MWSWFPLPQLFPDLPLLLSYPTSCFCSVSLSFTLVLALCLSKNKQQKNQFSARWPVGYLYEKQVLIGPAVKQRNKQANIWHMLIKGLSAFYLSDLVTLNTKCMVSYSSTFIVHTWAWLLLWLDSTIDYSPWSLMLTEVVTRFMTST